MESVFQLVTAGLFSRAALFSLSIGFHSIAIEGWTRNLHNLHHTLQNSV